MLPAGFLSLALICYVVRVWGTIDVNLPELEYLAARLEPGECRRLAAALHFASYELPENLAQAERELDPELPCLRLLLHWNAIPEEGRGQTHEQLERRLRQIGRGDLADWLGKTVFRELGKDLLRAVDEPFADLAKTEEILTTESASTEAAEDFDEDEDEDEDLWLFVHMVVVVLFAALLFTLVVLLGLIVINKLARCHH